MIFLIDSSLLISVRSQEREQKRRRYLQQTENPTEGSLKSGAVLRKGNSTSWIFSRHLKAVLCNINDASTLKQSTVTTLEFL
jgi:hypothetical protein